MKLSIETFGQGEPLVFIHGMGSAATAWKPLVKVLSNDFKLVLIDLPGHGQTPYSKNQPMDPNSLAYRQIPSNRKFTWRLDLLRNSG
jgi:pimeloyl-ACP methyl ester carboxylesterase